MNILADNIVAVAIIGVLVAVLAVIGFVLKRIHRVAPNEAYLVVGKMGNKAENGPAISSDTKVISGGGRIFVMPVLQEGFTMSLEQRQVHLEVRGPDSNRITTAVKAAVNFKVQGNEDGVRKAAQRFLSKQGQLESIVQNILEGALRDVIGSMSINEILSDKEKFKTAVLDYIRKDLDDQGLHIDQINISDIATPGSQYLDNLARKESARAEQEAAITSAQAKQASETVQIEADEAIAVRTRDFALKQAEITATTEQANARAAAAGQLARAEQDKLVAVQQNEALKEKSKVTESELDIKVKRPAEAQAYAQVKEAEARRDAENAQTDSENYKRTKGAEANKTATELDAQAAAAKVIASAQADAQKVELAGNAEKVRLIALSEGIVAEGKAKAEATKAQGLAEAEAIKARAEALKELGQAGLLQNVIEKLPEIVKAAADPIGRAENFTIVSNDGAGAVQKAVGSGLSGGLASIEALTGLDLAGLLTNLASKASTEQTAHETVQGETVQASSNGKKPAPEA